MVEEDHPRLSIVRQCELVSISRSSHYYTGKGESTLKLMRLLDAQFLSTPWYGSRQMARHLRRQGYGVRPQADSPIDAADGSDGHLPQAANVEA